MGRKAITISFDSALYEKLKKRAKKNYVEVEELIEDIVRRSMISYSRKSAINDKVDDSLVGIFSRKKRKKGK